MRRSPGYQCEGDAAGARRALIDALERGHDLPRIARAAAEAAGAADLAEPVAYCVAVLVQRRSDAPGSDGFAERLAADARMVAGHLAGWAGTYRAIQEEGEAGALTTLRRYLPPSTADDVLAVTAARLARIFCASVPLEEMTLELARAEEPSRSEFVFQSPLGPYIRVSGTHDLPRRTAPLEAGAGKATEDSLHEVVARRDDETAEILGLLIARVAELLATRELLASLIERADGFEGALAALRPATASSATLLRELRATIADIASRLRREQAALRAMIAYLVLAMGDARQMQRVAILCLRTEAIDPAARDAMSAMMQGVLADLDQPTPWLLARARDATRAGVSRHRAKALERLRDDPRRRAERLAPTASMLAALPARVAGDAAIAAALDGRATNHLVAQHRLVAAGEWDPLESTCRHASLSIL